LLGLKGVVIADFDKPSNNIVKGIHIIVEQHNFALFNLQQERIEIFFF
jgi:hypothetical protein